MVHVFHLLKMIYTENIAILAVLLQYFDISVIGFDMLFGFCIPVFERYCTSTV